MWVLHHPQVAQREHDCSLQGVCSWWETEMDQLMLAVRMDTGEVGLKEVQKKCIKQLPRQTVWVKWEARVFGGHQACDL